ncbi:uncharacterized protein LOC109829509 isoform X2 [Asparagus officinalis]|uniref:uncharacterized protein LOC109829509 isoform X2 n=1 Tax=Asparagus officinalis TaxID=4686 RepID=UPI00098E4793|nr:uncharacterized protein LOC109829509 isoform X2 [Asparagus officinalis]
MEKGKRRRMERRAADFSKTHDQIPSSFFKIMLGDFKRFLHIPLKLTKTIGCSDKQTVILRDSTGQSWRVKLSVVDGRLAFCEGWDDFVLDHSINYGQFIVLKLIEKFVFRVRIFGLSTCEIIDFDEKRNTKRTGIKRKTTEKTFGDSGFGSKIDKAGKEKASACNLKVLKTNDKGLEHVGKIYTNKVSPIVNEKRNNKSTGVKRKVTDKTLEVYGLGCKTDNRHALKKVSEEKTSTSNLKVQKTIEKSSGHVNNTVSHVVISKSSEEHLAATKIPLPLTEMPCDIAKKLGGDETNAMYSSEKSYSWDTLEDAIALEVVNRKFLLTESGVCHIVDENIEKPVIDLTADESKNYRLRSMKIDKKPQGNKKIEKPAIDLTEYESRNYRLRSSKIGEKSQGNENIEKLVIDLKEDESSEDETNAMYTSEKSYSWDTLEDAIALEVVNRKFLLTENGVCHIVDENIEKPVIDLTADESKNYRLRSMKIDKKPQGNKKIEKPAIDLTEYESRNYRLRSSKIGEKSQGNENIEKLVIDLKEDESRNFRLKSSKSGKKYLCKGIPCKARTQDHHNHSYNMHRYCLRSGYARKNSI